MTLKYSGITQSMMDEADGIMFSMNDRGDESSMQ